jgi:hypothetical protein
MQFVGSNHAAQVVGQDELPGKVNYYLGKDTSTWHTNIPTFARVEYQNVYPGIDLAYYGKQQQLEYDFIVAPGADPRAITLGFTGADRVTIDEQGDLVLHSAGGDVRQHRPFLYQEVGGVRQEVAGNFEFRGDGQVGFRVDAYDTSRPLIIDPPVYIYSSYLGGAGNDAGFGIAVDGNGYAYVTGYTDSPPSTWPAPPPPTLIGPLGGIDAFVTKVDTSGMFLQWTDYIGGSSWDVGQGIALGPCGVYVTGVTASPDFPVTAAAFQTIYSGVSSDGFAVQLDPNAGALLAGTFLGVLPGDSAGYGVGVDVNSNVYVTGFADTGGPNYDVLVISLDCTLSFANYLTFWGGVGTDVGYGIAVDPGGNAYVTGYTDSPNFPTTAGVIVPVYPGHPDGFALKLNSFGGLVWSTYLRLPGNGAGTGIAVNSAGQPYITGYFDGGPVQHLDSFFYRLTPPANAFLNRSTFGGPGDDVAQGIALDSAGFPYLIGWTTSPAGLPIVNPLPGGAFLKGAENAFVTKLNIGIFNAPPIYFSYFGGTISDAGFGIAVDPFGFVYMTGETNSPDFIPPAPPGFQPVYGGGGSDAFVTKII